MNARRSLALAGAAGAGLAWLTTRRSDQRAVAADPAKPALDRPLEGRRVPVTAPDGTELHVTEHGPKDAPTIVLVHGWTCTRRFWTLQVQALERDHHVVAYDLRGHGSSARPPSRDYGVTAHAGDLEAVLQATVPDGEKAVVAGHSLGGMTIVAWAGEHAGEVGDRLAAAALCDTGMGDLVTESLIIRTPEALATLQSLVGRVFLSAATPLGAPSPVSHRSIRYIALSPSASPAVVAFCEEMVLSCPRDVRAATGGALTRLDLYEAIESLTVPTIVVAGEADRLTPPVHARRLAETLPRLEEEIVIPGSGHMSPVSDPDDVTDVLRRLVREHAAAGAVA